MSNASTIAAYATPAALVAVAVIQGFFSVKLNTLKAIAIKTEEQTNSRLSALLEEVAGLKRTISEAAVTRTEEKLNHIENKLNLMHQPGDIK